MFQHLDDPHPPDFGFGARDQIVRRGRQRRQRTRATALSFAVVPLLAAGGSLVYLRSQADELERVAVGGLTELPPPSITSPTSEPTPAAPVTAPMNILVVGVDTRTPGDEVLGSRGDTIGVVRLDPAAGRVSLLSLPRDLWVANAAGVSGRINQLVGQPSELVHVVSTTLGIEVNHYVEIDFDGFVRLVDLAGGVTIPFDTAVRDESTGFSADAGCATLDGASTLAYVRSRRLQSYDSASGEWVQDPTSDLGRVARQQDVVRRLFRQVLVADYSTTDQLRIVTDVVDDIVVDAGLSFDDLRSIFSTASAIGPDGLVTHDLVVGLSGETIEGNAVLVADPLVVEAVVDDFLGGSSDENRPPSAILGDAIVPADPVC
jgi:LCP family protein required for cell wall assembly